MTESLQVHPRPEHTNIQTPEDLAAFVQYYFSYHDSSTYTKSLLKDLGEIDHNPDYLKFLGRNLLIAAEHGYPLASGHIENAHKHNQDPYDPHYILAMGVVLAKKTVEQTQRKLWLMERPNITKDNFYYLLAAHKLTGEIIDDIKSDTDVTKTAASIFRYGENTRLPLLIPDHKTLKQIAAINFQANPLDLHAVQAAYPGINIANVFNTTVRTD